MVASVTSGADEPMTFWTSDPNGVLSVGPGVYNGMWHTPYDSFCVIGMEDELGGTYASGDLLSGTFGWSGGYGTPESPGWVVNDGGYLRTGGAYGNAVAIGQVTITTGETFGFRGWMMGHAFDAYGSFVSYDAWIEISNVPGPGGLVLLGMAGLYRRRRRV